MDIKINDISKNKKEIKVSIPPEKVEKYSDKAVEFISSETKIDGFRPGKAPRTIIEEKFGKERIWNEACYQALRETYPKILEEHNFFVVSPPEVKIQSMEINKPLTYDITITILPEIILPDYKKISKEIIKDKKEINVSEKEIKETLLAIQKSRAKTKVVARSLEKSDEAVISFQGSIDGIKQEELKGDKVTFIIGEQKFIEGFEENLIGLKTGETKKFSVKMKTYEKNIEKIVDFDVNIHDIREREIPELNDEFALSLGNFSNLKDFQEKIKNNIKFEKELKEKEKIRIQLIEAISDKSQIDIPEIMIDKELDNMIIEYGEQLSNSGISFENYLKQIKKTESEIREEWRERAKKRLMASFILQEIAKKEKIEISKQEIESETNSYLSRINEQKINPPDQEKLKFYIKDIIQNEKVFQILES